jgi:hypothetical protein
MTEDREEFEKLSNKYYHIVYSDQVHVPQGTKVEDTLKLHPFCMDASAQIRMIQTSGSCKKMVQDKL